MLPTDEPGEEFSETETLVLRVSMLSASLGEIELPLTSKRIFLKVPRNHRAGRVVPPAAANQLPDAFTGDQIGLNAPFHASLKNFPTRGLSRVRPRMKGKPQSLA